MNTKSKIQSSFEGSLRFVTGLYMTNSKSVRVQSESKTNLLRAYIPVERVLLEDVRAVLGSFVSAYLDGKPLVVSRDILDNLVNFITQTDTMYLSPRKDSRGIIKL